MNSPSEELLTCPFCGSADVKTFLGGGDHYVQCMNCTACGPDHKNGHHWNLMMARKPLRGCYCPVDKCYAPKIMGRQTLCLRRAASEENAK